LRKKESAGGAVLHGGLHGAEKKNQDLQGGFFLLTEKGELRTRKQIKGKISKAKEEGRSRLSSKGTKRHSIRRYRSTVSRRRTKKRFGTEKEKKSSRDYKRP